VQHTCAAIGYEYNKVNPGSGTPQWDGTTQFSIPQFGDFIGDMVINLPVTAAQCTAGVVPAFPAIFDSSTLVSDTPTAKVSEIEDSPAVGTYTKYTYQYVDAAGNVKAVGDAATNFIRYCEYPGARAFRAVKFEVNGNPLDDYNSEAVLFHQKFRVAPNKLTGWKRLMGQEVPVEGFSDLMSIDGASRFPGVATDLQIAGSAAPAGAVTAGVTARKMVSVVSGPQTPKAVQPALSMWIPLLFWFRDTRQSIASVSIPYGQRYIIVDYATQARMLFPAPGNLFLRLTVETQVSTGANAGTAIAQDVSQVRKYVTMTPVLATGSVVDTNTGKIGQPNLYINNIFVNPEIHDIYIKRIGFSLIRVHRYQQQQMTTSVGEILLSNFKWPVETICVGMRPTANIDAQNPNQYRDWHRMTLVSDEVLETAAFAESEMAVVAGIAWNAATPVQKKYSSSLTTSEKITFPVYTETLDTLAVRTHGIYVYNSFAGAFYRDYLSFAFGGANLVTPEDLGAYLINFCLHPGTYQPSGHMNVSRAREFYVEYVSSYVSTATPADFCFSAEAINFLLISDGSAVLRYST
jgi:hypothetical protein